MAPHRLEWPPYIFAAGRVTIPYLRALHGAAGDAQFHGRLHGPARAGRRRSDLGARHDARRGDNVITSVTSPHGFSPARLAALRDELPEHIAALSGPRVTVLLGGQGGGFQFTRAAIGRLSGALRQMADLGASFLITPSRRTSPELREAVRQATANAQRIIWDGTGANPYPYFLAGADAFVVTADSVNMAGEACATGKPVYIFMPEGGRAKFHAFHHALEQTGATRPCLSALKHWTPGVTTRSIPPGASPRRSSAAPGCVLCRPENTARSCTGRAHRIDPACPAPYFSYETVTISAPR